MVYKNPDWREIIQPGLDKLKDYRDRLDSTPAYLLAMGVFKLFIIIVQID
jgi:hypothetical protein